MIRGILGNDVELVANVNPRNKKILTILPQVLGEITKHRCVQCFAGYNHDIPADYRMFPFTAGSKA